MELSDSFVVALPLAEAWDLLTDVRRLAPCVPGAHLTESSGDEHRGVVSVKLGVVSVRFDGVARLERDIERRRITILADGDGGQGHAEAHVVVRLEPRADDETQVNLDTDLQLEGRVAQLASGIIAETSTALTEQLEANLAAVVLAGHHLEAAPVEMPEPEALDLLDAARRPITKRLVPVALLVLWAARVWRRHRRTP